MTSINKKSLTKRDICTKFINPALEAAGWDLMHQIAAQGEVEQEYSLDEFPSPDELWQRLCERKNLSQVSTQIVNQDYYSDGSGRMPRYYQSIAINRAVEAIAARTLTMQVN